jgi:hypothetical protein
MCAGESHVSTFGAFAGDARLRIAIANHGTGICPGSAAIND